jgi:hypothetical protein
MLGAIAARPLARVRESDADARACVAGHLFDRCLVANVSRL